MSRLSQAAAAERLHAARNGELGEAEARPWVRAANGDLVAEPCDRCGDYGPVIDAARGWLCPACDNHDTTGGAMR